MADFFEGVYYKHQKGDHTLCMIVGKSASEEFIQVITKDKAYQVPFIGDNLFSEKGIKLNIQTDELSLAGEILYEALSPIKYDIMGPFQYFPMECRHGIVSMQHRLRGKVILNGAEIDFNGGTGYIEKDSGTSFPSSYVWIQANSFDENCSIMASVADIPFCGFHFKGCICIVQYQGKEYRLATYLGVKVAACTKDRLILQQGKYRLEIEVDGQAGFSLRAPAKGEMTRNIIEAVACDARFAFFIRDEKAFDLSTKLASYEYENKCF